MTKNLNMEQRQTLDKLVTLLKEDAQGEILHKLDNFTNYIEVMRGDMGSKIHMIYGSLNTIQDQVLEQGKLIQNIWEKLENIAPKPQPEANEALIVQTAEEFFQIKPAKPRKLGMKDMFKPTEAPVEKKVSKKASVAPKADPSSLKGRSQHYFEYISANPGVNITDLSKSFKVVKPAAHQIICKLRDGGFISIIKDGKTAKYFIK